MKDVRHLGAREDERTLVRGKGNEAHDVLQAVIIEPAEQVRWTCMGGAHI
jgi:hypothetical protein